MSTGSKKHILLSVTGMSPAVITETLYALVTEKKVIPTEIQVITTLQGKNKVMAALLGIEGGRQKNVGALAEFCQDYQIDPIHFDESCIHVIQDPNGEALPDIRTPEENQYAADQIISLVGELCQDTDTALHVSIAGGRKTMGFFLGYALSLYGREQDTLSHVLVEAQYENLPNFFYPKPNSYMINDRNGVQIDVAKAKVMLAEIPWVRLGLGVPEGLLGNRLSYSESITKAQNLLKTPSLTFLSPIDDRWVMFGAENIQLSPRGYALLLSICLFKMRDELYTFTTPDSLKRTSALYETLLDIGGKATNRIKLNDFKGILSDSRTDIQKKFSQTFGIKKTKSPYIPFSSNGCYDLQMDKEDIDITAIESELNHILR